MADATTRGGGATEGTPRDVARLTGGADVVIEEDPLFPSADAHARCRRRRRRGTARAAVVTAS